jgi:5-methylcytosine-specific restriction endonuclease McrA
VSDALLDPNEPGISASVRYYRRHTEKVKLRLKNYRTKHKDRLRERNRLTRLSNPERSRAACRKWQRSHKEQMAQRFAAWEKRNRKRRSEYQRLRYKNFTPEQKRRRREVSMAWHRKNPGYMSASRDKRKRAMDKSGSRVDLITRWVSLVRSKPFAICYYCQRVRSSMDVHFDHIIPLAKGGGHNVGNMCVACEGCNCSKGSRRISEWPQIPTPMLDL